MKEIDMTLFPTESEIIEATKNTTLTWLKTVTVAVSAARKDTVERFPQTWGDVTWVAGYVLIAGYIFGVRNERKRHRVKAARKRRDHEHKEISTMENKAPEYQINNEEIDAKLIEGWSKLTEAQKLKLIKEWPELFGLDESDEKDL